MRCTLILISLLVAGCGTWGTYEIYAPKQVSRIMGCGDGALRSGKVHEISSGVWYEVYLYGSEESLSGSELRLNVSFSILEPNALELKSDALRVYLREGGIPTIYQIPKFVDWRSGKDFHFDNGVIVLAGKNGYGAPVDRTFSTKTSAIEYVAEIPINLDGHNSFHIAAPLAELNGQAIRIPDSIFTKKSVSGYLGLCGGF